ncbi:unnamed protein product [Lathyrus oleraceus]
MEHLELNQVVLRKETYAMNHKVGKMLEALLALSKNNFQLTIIESVDHILGFPVVNNPLYDSPPQMDDHIQPQPARNYISNKIPMVQGQPIVQVGHVPPHHDTKNPHEVDPVINVRTHQDTEVIQMCCVLGEQMRALKGRKIFLWSGCC